MAGSHRDSRRVLPRFWPPGFPFPAVNPGGIPPGFPPGPAAILAAGISVPRRESRRDLGGITTGIPPRFWPPGFRFAPRALAGSPAEILAAESSLPAVNPGGILAGLPPGSRRDFGRRDFASLPESQRELGENSCRDFGRRGSASCRESRRDLGGLTHQDFDRRDFRLSKIPPRFVRLARLTCMEVDRCVGLFTFNKST